MLSRRSLLASMTVLAAGCGPLGSLVSPLSAPQETELNVAAYTRFITLLTLHDPGSPQQQYEKAVAALEEDKENPYGPTRGGYRLALRFIEQFFPDADWTTPTDKALVKVSAVLDGLDADLVTVWPELAQWLGRHGLLLPLNRFSGADEETLNQQFFPVTLDRFRVDGALFALPVSAAPQMLYYDAERFRAQGISPPADSTWDWDDLVENAARLTTYERDGTLQRWGLDAHSQGLWWALWQNGAALLDPNTLDCRLQESVAIEAFQFVHDLIHRHRVSQPAILKDIRDLVGKTPGTMLYRYPPQFLLPETYRMAALPRTRAHTVPVWDGFGIGIAARTQNTEAAYTALQGFARAMQNQVVIPAGREAVARLAETRTYLRPEEVVAIEQSLVHGHARPQAASQGNIMSDVVEALVRGDDVESVVNKTCAVVQKYQQTGEPGPAFPLQPDSIWNYSSGPP